MDFHKKWVRSVFRENGLFNPGYYFRTATATFKRCRLFQLVDLLSVRFSLSLVVDVSARRLSCSALPCGCAVLVFGVMRCDRFFFFLSHVGSHLSGGLLPLLLSPCLFVCSGLLRHSKSFSRDAQLSVGKVFASSVVCCVLRSQIGCPFSIKFPWRLLLFLVFSEMW